MKLKFGKKGVRLCSVLIIIVMLAALTVTVSGSTRYFSGEAERYYNALLDAGFPQDYAADLTELHLLHPTWNFVPLLITEAESSYTWEYILQAESEDPSNNLIFSSDTYRAYHHPRNKELYDSSYYQVSESGLAYFMDPRNFLNETDIFQFFDLASVEGVTREAVQAVLDGTFMEQTLLDNGMTYAEYFLQVGEELHVNPIYLAVKARQEQGVNGTSPIISGTCGTLLNSFYQNQTQQTESGAQVLTPAGGFTTEQLLALNGYYNFYNIKASGNGLFTIYYNAMTRAKEGTPDMTTTWGDPSWNTQWKSIYGGAYIIKNNYVDAYQNTIYLQKFNVDSRVPTKNFWKQYMQNVSGALTEARTLYTSFASMGALDSDCTFLIPVYGGMPKQACADPANGTCSYLAAATKKYEYSVFLTTPSITSSTSSACYATYSVNDGDTLKITGSAEHSYGVATLEYRWDHGDWIPFSENGIIDLSLPIHELSGSSHILLIRGTAGYDHTDSGKKSNYHFLCAVLYIDVTAPPEANVTLQNGDEQVTLRYTVGTSFPLPDREEENFIGWYGSDRTFLPPGTSVTVTDDVCYRTLFLNYQTLEGASLIFSEGTPRLRFCAAVESNTLECLTDLNASPQFFAAVLSQDTSRLKEPFLRETVSAFSSDWQMLYVDTETIVPDALNTSYKVAFYIVIPYTDGRELTLQANAVDFSRSAAEIAKAALNDTSVTYSSVITEQLQWITSMSELQEGV